MDRFVFPKSFYESIKTLKPAYREALYTGIFGFIFDDAEPELKSVELQRMWMLIFPILSKAKKISNTISNGTKDNLKTNSRDTKENVKRKPEQTKENVETISRQTPFKEKEKEKEKEYKDIPPKSPKGYSEEFDKFWKAYPRSDAKQDAYKAFPKALKKTTLDTLLKSLEVFKNTESWQRDNGKYIPYASTWLNGERWLDNLVTEVETPKPTAPELNECPVCKSGDLIHSFGRHKCNSCKLMWEWNFEDKRWETTL